MNVLNIRLDTGIWLNIVCTREDKHSEHSVGKWCTLKFDETNSKYFDVDTIQYYLVIISNKVSLFSYIMVHYSE
jgi:hypothetical protein